MGRPAGSRNKSSAPAVQAVQPVQLSNESTTQTGDNAIKRTYREGAATIEIPASNSTAALFPEYTPEPENTPETASQPSQASQPEDNVSRETKEKAEEIQTEAPVEKPVETPISTESTDDVFYLEDLLKKMNIDPSKVKTKTKIDGIEDEASILDVKKSYQLEKHLTKRGQQIGEERRQLEALRQELARTQQPVQESPTGDPQYDAMRQELDQLKSIFPALQPVIYQNARQQLANELKEQGFPDFMEYIDKIDARVGLEADQQKWNYYNTKEGAKQLYFQMKLEEQMKAPVKAPEPIKAQPRPPIVKIDGGNQPSHPPVDDWSTKYQELFNKWKENPAKNKHLLPEILRLKDSLSFK